MYQRAAGYVDLPKRSVLRFLHRCAASGWADSV